MGGIGVLRAPQSTASANCSPGGFPVVRFEQVGRGFTWTLLAPDGVRLARSATVFTGPRPAAVDLDGVKRLVSRGGCRFAVERFAAPRWRWSCEFRGVVVVTGLVLRVSREEALTDAELFAQSIVHCVPETSLPRAVG